MGIKLSDHLTDLKGKAYLPVAPRVAYFREQHPLWAICPEVVIVDGEPRMVRATIIDDNGRIVAVAHKTVTAFAGGAVEKAETGAVGRALSFCGIGTLDALDLDEGIARLGDIKRSVKAEYLTTGGQMKNAGRQILSRLGVQLGDSAVEEMTKQGTFEAYVNENVNRRIKELTGAAMGVEEAKRIIKAVPNLQQDPVTFMAVLEANEAALKASRMRLRYFAKQGLQWKPGGADEPPIALEDFVSMANRRASEIRAEVTAELGGAAEEDVTDLLFSSTTDLAAVSRFFDTVTELHAQRMADLGLG